MNHDTIPPGLPDPVLTPEEEAVIDRIRKMRRALVEAQTVLKTYQIDTVTESGDPIMTLIAEALGEPLPAKFDPGNDPSLEEYGERCAKPWFGSQPINTPDGKPPK